MGGASLCFLGDVLTQCILSVHVYSFTRAAAPAITAVQGFNGSAPAVDCRVPQGVLSQPAGESTTIEVVVTADPCPSVTWMYNGAEIDFVNNTVHVPGANPCPTEQEERASFTFSLTVSNITEGEGLYSALVENRAGSSTSEEVLVVPECEWSHPACGQVLMLSLSFHHQL